MRFSKLLIAATLAHFDVQRTRSGAIRRASVGGEPQRRRDAGLQQLDYYEGRSCSRAA